MEALADYGVQFNLILDKPIPANFTLQVGGITLRSEDATLNEASATYTWKNLGPILTAGDTVQISLTLAD